MMATLIVLVAVLLPRINGDDTASLRVISFGEAKAKYVKDRYCQWLSYLTEYFLVIRQKARVLEEFKE